MSAPNTERRVDIKHPDKFFIGGAWVEPSSTRRFNVVSPASEEVFFQVAEGLEADIERAVIAAREAFDNGPWPQMTPAERAGYLTRIAQQLTARAPELAHSYTGEVGVLYKLTKHTGFTAARDFDSYAALAATFPWVEEHKRSYGDGPGLLVSEPVGVVAAIVPWNAPLTLAIHKVAPALLAGCAIVLKPSPETPLDAYILAEIAEEIRLPPGVLNVVTADRGASEHLVRHPGVDKVSFTGSTAAGRRIASICGERIARCTLELGGKSAAIIMDDYNIESAAQTLAGAITLMSGQVCAALTRVVVPRKRHDEMVDALATSFQKITIGDPYDEATQLGPLAMKRQLERVESYIAKGRDEAKLITGGARPASLNRGYFIEPTLFANVDSRAVIAQEEIFGPVLSVIPADDEDDAVRIANDTAFGLNGAVFTNDATLAYRTARRIRSGSVAQNGFSIDFGIAFGGFKQSGIGREGGAEGLRNYIEKKTILLSSRPAL